MRDDTIPATAPSTSKSFPIPAARDTALDGMRAVAVLLMIASHTTRLITWDERREWSRFSLLIEPLTASLFLILVGASLVQSYRKAQATGASRAAWLRRQGLRALALWVLSAIFYIASEGFLLPDALVLSGILATIAYTSVVGSLLVAGPRPALSLALAAGALMALYAWIDLKEIRIFILNAGNSPLFPLSIFGLLGSLGALALSARVRWLKPLMLACAVLAMGTLLWHHGFREVFSKPMGRYETARMFLVESKGAKVEKNIPYYNLRIILVPAILPLAVLLYALLAALRPLLDRSASWLLRLGRRSLDVYILHLAILSILVLTGGKRPLKESWLGDAVFLGVIGICYLWVWGRDAYRSRRMVDAP